MRVIAIAQARSGSSRFPNKVLERLGEKTILDWVIRAMDASRCIHGMALAVPAGDIDLVDIGSKHEMTVVEGSEDDVLARYISAAEIMEADAIVRLTADCPLLDPTLIDNAVEIFAGDPCDYLFVEGYPRGVGDIEILSRSALESAGSKATIREDREHVITYISNNPKLYSVRILRAPPGLCRPGYRLCVDEAEDLEAIRALYLAMGSPSTPADVRLIIETLDKHPEIRAINEHVSQRS
ncbi:MAG TPA: hypothetical protein VMU77_03285 [Acidimicrobiales bacterium]|nr:hypothetical protein [Acidimicrobiales bacterium]